MQEDLYNQNVGLESNEKDSAEDREDRQEDHEESVTNTFNSVTFLASVDPSEAKNSEKGDHKKFKEELTFRESKARKFEDQQAE